MKSIIVCLSILSIGTHLFAQQTVYRKSSPNKVTFSQNSASFTSNSESSHAALGYSNRNFTIADPTLIFLNDRANGLDNRFYKSPIVGERKHTYGFADGHLILSTSGAPSSGTITGSGAVGTGSTAGSLSSNTYLTGVNGKSPYAGPTSWGTGVTGQGINVNDSSIRTLNHKKKK